jgi:hypothetical protein
MSNQWSIFIEHGIFICSCAGIHYPSSGESTFCTPPSSNLLVTILRSVSKYSVPTSLENANIDFNGCCIVAPVDRSVFRLARGLLL